jgi:hypothetical protein
MVAGARYCSSLPCYRRNQNAVNGIGRRIDRDRIEGRGTVMTLSRVLPLALVLAVLPLAAAHAQFGGMPGMPGSPGMPGAPGMPEGQGGMSGSPFGAPQQAPPPACQQLLGYRDETAKHGQALQAAGKKKAPPDEICKLFKVFIAAETKFVKGLEDHSATCGVPPEAIKQLKLGHSKAMQTAKSVCDAAAQGPRQAGPTLSDALGTTATVPNASSSRGQGTFDTLMGSPLVR